MSPRISIFSSLVAAFALAAAGCSKRAPEAKPEPVAAKSSPTPVEKPAPAQVTQPVPKPSLPRPKPAPLPEPEPTPRPEILFSLRGLESGRLTNDRPLLVGVRVESSVDKEAALSLAPASGSWSNAVSVELGAVESPDKVLLRAKRIDETSASASATLGTSGQVAEGTWLLSSAEIAQLSPGNYRVQVKLAIADGAGWHGLAEGEPVDFALVPAGGNSTPEQQTQRALALAGEALLAKDYPKAAQILDERLAAEPENVDVLKARAALCLEGGNVIGANACVGHAWARIMREKWTHPPEDLAALDEAVSLAMLKPPAGKEPLPAWSMPPATVLAPLPVTPVTTVPPTKK